MSESRIYGVNACLNFYKHQKRNIKRAFFSKKVAPKFTEAMKFFATQKKVYRIVSDEELEKISKSMHHEGVCLVVEHDEIESATRWLNQNKNQKRSFVLALEKVANPHNLGAIMRICAHFDISVIAHTDARALQSGAAHRTSEGGALFIEPIQVDNFLSFISEAKKCGYQVVATSSHGGESLYKAKLADKVVLMFGEEGPGLSEEVMKKSDLRIQIPGTGNVESLNVSTAIAIILSEVSREIFLKIGKP